MPSTTDAPTRRVSTRHTHPTPRGGGGGGDATAAAAAAAATGASNATPARPLHIPQHIKEPSDNATPRSAKSNVSTPGGSKTTLGKGVKQLPGGGGIFKSAAVAVLRLERKLMSTGDITRVALERGLINCQGKTPEATMASALYTDVKKKEGRSIFTRPQEGLFGLKEWAEEGFVPEPVMVDGGGGTPSEAGTNREAAAASLTPADGTPKSKRTRSMTLRQRTDMRKPWMVDDDDVDSRGTSATDSPGARELSMTPKEKSGSDYAATELPGKQRLKNALRMQQQGQDSVDSPFGDSRGATGDSGGSRGQGGGSSGKKRPRLHVEVPGGGPSDPHHGIQQLSGAQQAAMARALAAQQQGGRSSSQNNSDLLNFLDASRLIGSGGIAGMDPPGLTSFLPTSLESGPFSAFGAGGLRSPLDAAILGSLDTPALMNMPIPDGVPLTPEALAAAAIRSGLTPRWGLTPRMNGGTAHRSFPSDDSPDAKRTGSSKANNNHNQGSSYKAPQQQQQQQQQQQLFQAPSGGGGGAGSSAHPAMKSCAAAAEVAESSGGLVRTGSAIQGLVTEKWQQEEAADKSRNDKGNNGNNNNNGGNGRSSQQQQQQRRGSENGRTQQQGGSGSGGSSLDELQRRIVALEVSLGPNHPQVGKAWLFLCRSAHLIGGQEASVRAEQALMRAREICAACSKTQTISSSADKSFSYLLERVRTLSTGS